MPNLLSVPFQDQYLEARADCWGCGRNNSNGLFIKSTWSEDGQAAIAHFNPRLEHTGHKGVLNGGIIATLMDCHCMGLAMAHAHCEEGRAIGTEPLITYVTASLKVDYLQPTPLTDHGVDLHAEVEKVEGRKTWMRCGLFVDGVETARGAVLGIRIDEPPDGA